MDSLPQLTHHVENFVEAVEVPLTGKGRLPFPVSFFAPCCAHFCPPQAAKTTLAGREVWNPMRMSWDSMYFNVSRLTAGTLRGFSPLPCHTGRYRWWVVSRLLPMFGYPGGMLDFSLPLC